MSVSTSRPRVSGVAGAALGAAMVGGVVLAARLIGALVRHVAVPATGAAVRGLSAGALCVMEAARAELAKTLPAPDIALPLSALREERAAREAAVAALIAPAALAPAEKMKVQALLAAEATAFLAAPAVVEGPVRLLLEAATAHEAERAGKDLLRSLERGHERALLDGIVHACRTASMEAGMSRVAVETSAHGRLRRVIGTDEAGRALITEVRADAKGDIGLETEVVGVSDGSCHELLDRFDRELESQGVRSAGSSRTFTGGVCEMAFAREFLRRHRAPRKGTPQAQAGAPKAEPDARRRQRLNAPDRARTR